MFLRYQRDEFKLEVRKAIEIGRMSISGVQPKAQMNLATKNGPLVVVETGGKYILKPTPEEYPEAAENEHVSMRLARLAKFETPECGLVGFKSSDELAYVIRRFDRIGETKLHHEDMMQVFGINNEKGLDNRNGKYDAASYLDILVKIKEIAGMGVVLDAFRRVIFNYFIGNDDYHLKNISLMHGDVFKMSPMYDCLNSSLYSDGSGSPLALRLTNDDRRLPYYGSMGNGFYSGKDFIVLAEGVAIKQKVANNAINRIINMTPKFINLIQESFLSNKYKQAYIKTIKHRSQILWHQ